MRATASYENFSELPMSNRSFAMLGNYSVFDKFFVKIDMFYMHCLGYLSVFELCFSTNKMNTILGIMIHWTSTLCELILESIFWGRSASEMFLFNLLYRHYVDKSVESSPCSKAAMIVLELFPSYNGVRAI